MSAGCITPAGCVIRIRTGRFRVYEAREPLLLHSRVKDAGTGIEPVMTVLRTALLPIEFPAIKADEGNRTPITDLASQRSAH